MVPFASRVLRYPQIFARQRYLIDNDVLAAVRRRRDERERELERELDAEDAASDRFIEWFDSVIMDALNDNRAAPTSPHVGDITPPVCTFVDPSLFGGDG